MANLRDRLRRLLLGAGLTRERRRQATALDRLSRQLAALQYAGLAAPGFATGLEATLASSVTSCSMEIAK